MDEYFPEIYGVFKKMLTGKVSRQVLKSCPFPKFILELWTAGILAELRKAVKKSVGMKKVRQMIEAARESIGVRYGLEAARMRLKMLLEVLEMIEHHLCVRDRAVDGIGSIQDRVRGTAPRHQRDRRATVASFLGEVGDPLRFQKHSKSPTMWAAI